MAEKIVLTLGCAPGDITCLTALPRDIATTYPDRYEIHVATHAKSLWRHNPYIAGVHTFENSQCKAPLNLRRIPLPHACFIKEANRCKLHFVTAFHRAFQKAEGVTVPCLKPKGDLYLDPEQYKNPPVSGRYWLIVTGGKSDFTVKVWSARLWQRTTHMLRERGVNLVQTGALHRGHYHPPMDGALNLVGWGDLRDLMWLIYHSEGVICPITCMMHMAAVFDKPAVVVAGGREHYWWEAYVNIKGMQTFGPYAEPVKVPHRYLHTQGMFKCCEDRGCWQNKIIHTQADKHGRYCKLPKSDGYGQIVPQCLMTITPELVVDAVMSYYEDA
jgi:ADP-heptose:LPS heptosyltransferase